MKSLGILCAVAIALAIPSLAHAADSSCAAVSFHGIPPGASESQPAEAGLYRAKFGMVTIDGTRKGDSGGDYTISVKGTKLDIAKSLPDAAKTCLKSKSLSFPETGAPQSCAGDKVKLVIVPQGKERILILYAGAPKSWNYCHTSIFGG